MAIDRITTNTFELVSKYNPAGDQGQAIDALVENIENGEKAQILRGATGTCPLYTSPSPRDRQKARMPASA